MKKRKTAAFLAALMICAWVPQAVPGDFGVLVAEAHSGRTDRYGGHRDNKNKSGLGSYHYHCGGHPAHLHENGVCPYASYVEEATPAVSPEETAAEAPENLYMVFDPIYYADHNPDLYEAFGYDTDQLQEHFLTCGMKEGRPGCADFNVAVYKEQNADLAAAYGDDLAAYLLYPLYGLRPRRGARLPLRRGRNIRFCSGPGSWGAFMREGFCPRSYAGGGPPGAG